jgi:hypothetical protein
MARIRTVSAESVRGLARRERWARAMDIPGFLTSGAFGLTEPATSLGAAIDSALAKAPAAGSQVGA